MSNLDPQWTSRLADQAELKRSAAKACLQNGFVAPFEHIFLDCGSTFVYLAEEILSAASQIQGVAISTTNGEIFQLYLDHKNRNLIDFRMIGGRFIPYHHSFDGSNYIPGPSVDKSHIFDRAFIGVCPIDDELRVMATVTDVIEIKQRILSRTKEVIIVFDETKLAPPP